MRKAALALLLLLPVLSFAQDTRSYHYGLISVTADVKKDTTVTFEEQQIFLYNGTYHQADRIIPHKALDAITDISVVDTEGQVPLTYSSRKLDKNDPTSWNHYTTYEENGQTYIEWYYDLSRSKDPSKHSWLIRYTVHGALAFYKDHDELYWNLFTDYDVPVDVARTTVHLPMVPTKLQASFYTTGNHGYNSHKLDESTFQFDTSQIAPKEAVTFALGWEKGIVDQEAYWRDLVKTLWPIFAAALILAGSVIFAFSYRAFLNRRDRGRGTIVPEYEPPSGIRPAMMELVLRGRLSRRAWASTVVDLAVRGYVTIREDEEKSHWWSGSLFRRGKEYVVEHREKQGGLEDYEVKFLSALFSSEVSPGGVFSTRALRKAPSRGRHLYKRLRSVEKMLDNETQKDTRAFAVKPMVGKWIGGIIIFAVYGVFLGYFLVGHSAVFWLIGSAALSAFIIHYVVNIRARLNKKGHLLKEHILGFKMYLKTAEKYRLQNLTPELFEKFLPYAMIFGVEKKWAKTFESISVPPPNWYSGAYAAHIAGTPAPGFSPASFTGSFSASFASAFSSAGGGGASSGGGGAGGGGGGGGGGAS